MIWELCYLELRPEGMEWASRYGLTAIFNEQAAKMATAMRNHVQINASRFLRRYLRVHVQLVRAAHPNSITAEAARRIVDVMLGQLKGGKAWHSRIYASTVTRMGRAAFDALKTILPELKRDFPECLPITNVQHDWRSYLPLMHHILAFLEQHPTLKGSRLFTLLPKHGNEPVSISVSTQGLYQLHTLYKKKYRGRGQNGFQRNRQRNWYRCMHLPRITTRNRRFEWYLTSNGLSANVLLSKPQPGAPGPMQADEQQQQAAHQRPQQAPQPALQQAQQPAQQQQQAQGPWPLAPFANLSAKREDRGPQPPPGAAQMATYGVDTGRIDILVAIDNLLSAYARVLSLSNRQMQQIGGMTQDRLKRQVWVDNDAAVKAAQEAMPSAGVGHASGRKEALKEVLARYAHVVVINEHRSSKVCSACNTILRRVRGPSGRFIWQVKRCPGCKRFWNRDVNAARNIPRGLKAWLEGRPRPRSLCCQ
ncbi:hypothetical protein WJX72_007354 [[Myrmecia] bisecta]|uniref:Cas12f1-like TNB domain-containing protein n=1 Tax=[Myrmecia] bisecta TaxID=41462 RepID=A0AAW1Q881_9CHLO